VDIAETIDDLLEDDLGIGLLQSASLPHIVKEVTTGAQFHHDDDVLFRFNSLVDLHDVVVSEFKKQANLLHQLLLLCLISEALLVQRFDGNQLSHELMHGEVDFSESTTA
jgi:hypothetical protein